MTPTGRETGEQLFGNDVLRCYLPYDYPFAVRNFLAHFRPQLGLLLETEIWPNLVGACHDAEIPLCLVNARLSPKSLRRYARFGRLIQTCLRQFAAIAAQTGEDAQRLVSLGARDVAVMGNLKFDITPPDAALALGHSLRQGFGPGRKVFLAASTRDGEEERILDALQNIAVPGLLTVIVPRHPQRFDEVAQLLERRGVRYQRRSAQQAVSAETQVLLGDSMGEMFAYYAACDVAFIGGSLLPYGGQNLIEACSVGKPAILGMHTFNFADAAELAVEAGATLRVADEFELAREVRKLLLDPELRQRMGQAGLAFSRRHQGATGRVMALLQRLLPSSHASGDVH
jgi:3-deoxy-D-manno-octulosonic-acid transferase